MKRYKIKYKLSKSDHRGSIIIFSTVVTSLHIIPRASKQIIENVTYSIHCTLSFSSNTREYILASFSNKFAGPFPICKLYIVIGYQALFSDFHLPPKMTIVI